MKNQKVWAVTEKGTRTTGRSGKSIADREGIEILRFLKRNGEASADHIAVATGIHQGSVNLILPAMKRQGLVAEVGTKAYFQTCK